MMTCCVRLGPQLGEVRSGLRDFRERLRQLAESGDARCAAVLARLPERVPPAAAGAAGAEADAVFARAEEAGLPEPAGEARGLYERAREAAQDGRLEEAVGLLGQALAADTGSAKLRQTLRDLGRVWATRRLEGGDWEGMLAARRKVKEMLGDAR
jgi:hypothetical protein